MTSILSSILEMSFSLFRTTKKEIDQTKHVVSKDETKYDSYEWSKDTHEKLVYIFHHLEQENPSIVINEFQSTVSTLLTKLTTNDYKTVEECKLLNKYVDLCMRMIVQTRDIINGKGEYDLSYKLLLSFALSESSVTAVDDKIMIPQTEKMLYYFVNPLPEENKRPYGSWKDIKKFMGYVFNQMSRTNKAVCKRLLFYCCDLYIHQLRKDLEAYNKGTFEKISLCPKWIPRENSKYGWVFKRIAKRIYCERNLNNLTDNNTFKYYYKQLRRLVSTLNKSINTLEIKQCSNNYADIDFSKVPSIAMTRQKMAFMNLNKKGEKRSDSKDRIEASNNFNNYINTLPVLLEYRDTGWINQYCGVNDPIPLLENTRYNVSEFDDVHCYCNIDERAYIRNNFYTLENVKPHKSWFYFEGNITDK